MSNTEEKVETSPSCPLSSLPVELALNCLARVSRSDYAALSLVSKRYRSLLVSPELYKKRSLLGYTKKCLYICLRTPLLWLMLRRESTVNRFMSPIPLFPSQPWVGSSVVALDWGIYVIGGSIAGESTSDVWLLDCRINTWRKLPSMAVARSFAAARVLEGKIYVVDDDGCGEVFDPKTQIWDTVVPVPDWTFRLNRIHASFVIEEKVYAVQSREVQCKILYYSPSDGKWGRRDIDSEQTLSIYRCVMVDKLLYSLDHSWNLFWCEPKEFKWKEVKGLETGELFGSAPCFHNLSNFGENIMVFWNMAESSEIWCAEISLERRKEEDDEIWGKVEWSDALKSQCTSSTLSRP